MRLRQLTQLCVAASFLGIAVLAGTVYLTLSSLSEHERKLAHTYDLQQRVALLSQGINHLIEQRQPGRRAGVLGAEITALIASVGAIDQPGARAATHHLQALEESVRTLGGLTGRQPGVTPAIVVDYAQTALRDQLRGHEAGLGVALQTMIVSRFQATQTLQYRSTLVLAAVALVVAALAVIAFWWVYRRVGVPLTALRAGVAAIDRGERDYRIEARSRDELGELASAFNGMAVALQQHEALLVGQSRHLQIALDQQQVILDTLPANIALLDVRGNILNTNSGWRNFGDENGNWHEPGVNAGPVRNYLEVCDATQGEEAAIAAEAAAGVRSVLAGELPECSLIYHCKVPGQPACWYRMMVTPLPGDPLPKGAVVMHLDVTDRKLAEQALSRTAYEEPVTGLLSRAGVVRRLQDLTRVAASEQQDLCLLVFDLRKLNDINQSCGYTVGDQLLRAVGLRVSEALYPDELLGCLGGGQFVGVFNGRQRGLGAPRQVGAWLGTLLEAPFRVEQHTLYVNATTAGVAYDPGALSPETLLRQGQLALQTARERGQPWILFDPAFEQGVQERIWTTVGLRDALAQGHFELHYQPKVSLVDGQIMSAEALLRWRHPSLGLRSPERFIPIAESSQLIIPIGEWALREACENLRRWQQQGLDAVRVAVNVSMVQFMHSDVVAMVRGILEEVGLDPGALSLEITESVFEQESARLLEQMEALRVLGVRLSLDDFGTGYSSLSHLRHYPFDEIKIDRSFVEDCVDNAYSKGVIEMIMGLARSLNCSVVAEGIEQPEQRDLLVQLGCQVGQGYLYSRPLSGQDFHDLLARGATLPGRNSPALVQMLD